MRAMIISLLGTAAVLSIGAGRDEPPATASASRPATAPATRPTGGSIFGDLGDARRVVFVCDAQPGVMISLFPILKQELAKAVAGMKEGDRSFNVIFSWDEKRPLAFDNKGLVAVNDAAKKRFSQWLDDAQPTGMVDSLPAIRLAFSQRPDLVIFVAHGEFNTIHTHDQIVDVFARSNVGKARVDTVLLDINDADAAKSLERIAAAHKGSYRFVKETDEGLVIERAKAP